MLDLVYIIKKSEKNEDLRYSLRSVEKFVPHDKIWIVGYKPSWVTNVEYLPVEQNGNKWKNSINNILAACKCNKISNNFVLMNDDFFAIKPIKDLEESINLHLGTLESAIKKYKLKKVQSNWMRAFQQVYDLLKELNIKEPYYNYESHTPLLINKLKYYDIMNMEKVKEFSNTSNILHKRTLYANIEKPINQKLLSSDVKLNDINDDTLQKIKICDWISVFDNQVSNYKHFPSLNSLLNTLFPNPCKYEIHSTIQKSIISKKFIKSKTFYKF